MRVLNTNDPAKVLEDFIRRMDKIKNAAEGKEATTELMISYSLLVQIESEKARFGLELAKIQLLSAIENQLGELRVSCGCKKQ